MTNPWAHRRPPLDPTPLGFRRLTEADLAVLHRWLHAPHVARWWYEDEPITLTWVVAKYQPRIAGQTPTRCFVITYAAVAIGFIQVYRTADYPDYSRLVAAGEDAAGVDLLIGEADYAYRGLGAPLLRRFLREVVFAEPDIACCVIGPEPKNTAAIRAYEKAGFRAWKTIQAPDAPEPDYLMRLARADLPAG